MESFLGWMIESSLFILLVLGIRKIFAGKIQYAVLQFLWLVVFLRFLVPVNLISTPYSAGNLFQSLISFVAEKGTESTGYGLDAGSVEKSEGFMQQGQGMEELTETALSRQMGKDGVLSAEKKSGTALDEKKTALEKGSMGQGDVWFRGLRWGISGLLLLWFFLSNCVLVRRLKKGRIFYRKKEKISVYQVSGLESPCLYGFFRPVIYIPKNLVSENLVTEEEMEQILTHEYVHFQHKDHLISVFRMILSAVYFFDPFLLYAVSCSKKDTELFCDETVIRLLGEKKRFTYGKMLIRLAGESHISDFRYVMLTMSRRGREMENRIRAIGRKRNYSKRVLVPVALIAALGLSVTCSAGTISFAGLRKSISVSGKKEDRAEQKKEIGSSREEEPVVSADREEILMAYGEFLKVHAGSEGFSYYSLANLEQDSPVLFVTDTVDALTEGCFGSSSCKAYRMNGKRVEESMELECDQDEWLRVSDGFVWMGTREKITKVDFSSDAEKPLLQSTERVTEEMSGENTEYMTWLGEYAKVSGIVFHENPFISDSEETEEALLSVSKEDFESDIYAAGKLSSIYVSELENTFEKYWEYFTEAVNTGKTEKLSLVLDKDSIAYEEQCKWAKNYYERGIREKVKRYQIVSMEVLSLEEEVIHSAEVIKTTYSDGSRKNLRQKYLYHCRYTENGWRITYMESEDAAKKEKQP